MPNGRISEIESKNTKIDVKDRKILCLLSEDARMPLSQITSKVGLSRDAVDYRIKRLVRKKVIMSFFPIIDLKKFGYYTFHIFLLLDERDREKQEQLIEDLKQNPYVKSIIEYSDRWDLEITLVARDVQEFDQTVMGITSKYPNLILEKSKLEIIKGYNSIHLPKIFHKDVELSQKPRKQIIKKISLDKKDLQILRILASDARLSTYKIAPKVGLSADAVGYRIKKMYDASVIRRFTILVDLTKLNYHWYTFCISVKMFDQKNDSKFNTFIKNHPHILRCVKTLGVWDLMLYIVADSSRNFHSTVKEIKRVFSDIIKNYDTWVAYKEHAYFAFPKVLDTIDKLREIKDKR